MYYANLSDNKFVLPGRVRVAINNLRGNKTYADKIIYYLSAVQGIHRVSASHITGNVLVLFDENALDVYIIEQKITDIKNLNNNIILHKTNLSQTKKNSINDEQKCLNKLMLSGSVLAVMMIKQMFFGRTSLAKNYGLFSIAAITSIMTGYPMFRKGLSHFKASRQINCDMLLGLSALSCVVLRESTLSLFTITIGYLSEVIEHYTHKKSQNAVQELLRHKFGHVRKMVNHKEVYREYDSISIGDTLMLYEDDYVPVDGRIIHGKAVVNHTLLTGESGPIYAHTGDMLYSGAIIDEGSVTIEVTDIGTEAQYKKVLTLINNSWKEHLEAVNVVDKYYHTVMPYAIAASIMGLVLTGSFMTFITVLLIACPGPAYIAAPVAMRSAFITACNQGILLRNPDSLETIGTLDTMIFDKTGTLSTGHPQVVDIINTDFYSEDEVLAIAASCEKNQNHPVAKALLRESKMRKLVLKDITAPHYQIGKGISCVIDDKETVVGNAKMMADKNVILKNAKAKEKQLKQLGQSPVYVAHNGKLIGLIGIKDTLRPETPSAIKYIHELGIQENEIISGDDQLIVANMAKELNINAYYGNMLPENKRDVIAALKKKHRITAMVGDGINDCAALSGAHIGITLADRLSRETLECSDVVIMNNNLQSIPALIDLGRFTESNMRQSYHLSVGLNIIGILLVFTNCINPFFASFYKDLNSLLVLINSLRPLKYKIKYLGVGE